MNFKRLINQIKSVQQMLQVFAANAVNTALTVRNWLTGYYIVEFEQSGADRAKYGTKLLKTLETKLKTKSFTERRLREYRRFYKVYPQLIQEIGRFVPNLISQTAISANITSIRHSASAEFRGVSADLILRKILKAIKAAGTAEVRRSSGSFVFVFCC